MSIRALSLFTGAVVALSAAIGCGGSGEPATPTIAKAAFVKRATVICKGAAAKLESEAGQVLQEVEASSGKSGREAEAEFIPKFLVPLLEAESEELRALGAPSGDEDRIDAMLGNLEEVTELAKSNPERYLYEQANFKHPYHEVEKLTRAYGIPDCGQP